MDQKEHIDYADPIWPLIYDQYNSHRADQQQEVQFYVDELKACSGRVLELGCGTGMVLFKLLDAGIDAYGLDVSETMLDALRSKAAAAGYDVRDRLSHQSMVNFEYDRCFEAICIPARAFLHLLKQDDQIMCLRTIYQHLEPGGRLLLNFFHPNTRYLAACSVHPPRYHYYDTYTHPHTGKPVKVMALQVQDSLNQRQAISWKFLHDGGETVTDMLLRWIYKDEFQLLLRLGSFDSWKLYGDFNRSPCTAESHELVWIAQKQQEGKEK